MSSAKSMASSYLNGKRHQLAAKPSSSSQQQQQPRFKSSASNLSMAPASGANRSNNSPLAGGINGNRTKSTSMTSLVASNEQPNLKQRPASRSALDSIHQGMNAKYAQVQSKVYQQNIKSSSTMGLRAPTLLASGTPNQRHTLRLPAKSGPTTAAAAQLAALQARAAQLEEQAQRLSTEAELRRSELERERLDKTEQVGRLRQELEEKASEWERQQEEQHRKLLEAYELADQNRRATDSLLAESRQRDEEQRKRREQLEAELLELRDFVQMKEEMGSKMAELREQLREERERYEQQLTSLRQVFETEKMRLEVELMEKVRQVGESYELSRYRSLNKTIELDARLANERLLATKLRLGQVQAQAEALGRELRQLQAEHQRQARKLAAAETMLRQLQDERRIKSTVQRLAGGRLARRLVAASRQQQQQQHHQQQQQVASVAVATTSDLDQVRSDGATQTAATSRTMLVIKELRQRLHLAGAKAKGARWLQRAPRQSQPPPPPNPVGVSQRDCGADKRPATGARHQRSLSLEAAKMDQVASMALRRKSRSLESIKMVAATAAGAKKRPPGKKRRAKSRPRRAPLLDEGLRRHLLAEFLAARKSESIVLAGARDQRHHPAGQLEPPNGPPARANETSRRRLRRLHGGLLVQYELPAASPEPIALASR